METARAQAFHRYPIGLKLCAVEELDMALGLIAQQAIHLALIGDLRQPSLNAIGSHDRLSQGNDIQARATAIAPLMGITDIV